MRSRREMSRRDFLHGILHPFSGSGEASDTSPGDACT